MNLKMKSLRTLKGYSQEALAKKIDCSRQTIVLIEKETYNPSLDLMIKICKALDVTLNDLFWKDEKSE